MRKAPVPWFYWPLWLATLAAGLFVFYVLFTPVWIGIRLVEWLGHRWSGEDIGADGS